MQNAQLSAYFRTAGINMDWVQTRPHLFEQISQSWGSTKVCAHILDLVSIGVVQGPSLSVKEGESLRQISALHAQYRESLHKLAPRDVLQALGESRAAAAERDQARLTVSMAGILTVAQSMVAADNVEVVSFLQSNFIDLNQKDRDGLTVCAVAAQRGAKDCLLSLFRSLANPNLSDSLGNTPAHWACAMSQSETLGLLLYHGVNPNAANHAGVTPLMLALSKGHMEMSEKLLQYGADMSLADRRGNTALHRALQAKGTEVIRFLLSAGAPTDTCNADGTTPFNLAMLTPEYAVMFNEAKIHTGTPREGQSRKAVRQKGN